MAHIVLELGVVAFPYLPILPFPRPVSKLLSRLSQAELGRQGIALFEPPIRDESQPFCGESILFRFKPGPNINEPPLLYC